MAVLEGRVTAKRFVVEVEGKEYEVPDGCDQAKFAAVAEKDVQVLVSNGVVVAIRDLELDSQFDIPVITCYLVGPVDIFRDDVLAKVGPAITEALVGSGHLESGVVEQLAQFQRGPKGKG